MLNISSHGVRQYVGDRYSSIKFVEGRKAGRALIKTLVASLIIVIIIAFLPWTQNIRSHGHVTTLRPEQRPQSVPSIIDGRIEAWFVQEGDFVNRGDTILFISEIKDEYWDPQLLDRTEQQLKATEMKAGSYMEKAKALENQIDALIQTAKLEKEQAENKLQQAKLKVRMDSIEFSAARENYRIAQQQYKRFEKLHDEGLKSTTELENRERVIQQAQADMISWENKFLSSRNDVLNAMVELNAITARYQDEISKAESEKYTALSSMYDTEASVTKLQNQYVNYSVRTGMYYIMAPQTGYITEAVQFGIGHTVKQGEEIVTIMPAAYDLAVEMYVEPFDLPLLTIDREVRIQFDGWPAIVFTGWPEATYGTYGGRIFAIDNFISPNGKFRILVKPDPESPAWPSAVRVGSGTSSIILLNDVPVWYEVWRQINGFPPNFYGNNTAVASVDKK